MSVEEFLSMPVIEKPQLKLFRSDSCPVEVATAEEKIPAMMKPKRVKMAKQIDGRRREQIAKLFRLQAQHVRSRSTRPDWLLEAFRRMACL